MQDKISEKISLMQMLAVSSSLEGCLHRCSVEAASPQLRDELQKLTAAAAGHTALIKNIMKGGDNDAS